MDQSKVIAQDSYMEGKTGLRDKSLNSCAIRSQRTFWLKHPPGV